MYLQQKLLYHITFIALFIYLPLTKCVRNKNLVATRMGLEEVSPCSVGLKFFTVLNNTSDEDYFVELISDECCISSDKDLDCESIEIVGDMSEIVERGTVRKFTLVAPLIDPYERKGYCSIYVDSRPVDKRSNVMRDTIKIYFDTGLGINKVHSKDTIKKCKNKDEDPFNDCKPVNCDTYYNGKKPIFDPSTKRCKELPKCEHVKSELNVLYDPISNLCVDGDPIDNEDIDFIKSIAKERQPEDVIVLEFSDSPVLFKSDMQVLPNDTTNKLKTNATELKKHICEKVIKYVTGNKYMLCVLGMVIFTQCCIIVCMVYCFTKEAVRCDKKVVERKYYNYRQDVSVTTPLIGTSNIDTETTGFDYVSESSKIDNKIKCYKACQKERTNDAKNSMSDDILSKCLNRRDWTTKPKSDTIKDVNNAYFNSLNADWEPTKLKIHDTIPEQHVIKKNIKEEKEEGAKAEKEDTKTREYKEDYGESDSSEKIIQCHDYNVVQTKKNESFSNNSVLDDRAVSMSIEKGAQACFSNDTVDDFLSERGMMFLNGETLSKYSFASDSTSNSSGARTSKTSKKNIIKNVLSFLSKKSKKCTYSDPGTEKSKGKDLELIHMSRASMYSSSASEYKNAKGLKLAKDSRTSF